MTLQQIMPEGYYEAIAKHVRRPSTVLKKPAHFAGTRLNAKSYTTINATDNETNNSDQDGSEGASEQDVRIDRERALEITKASFAICKISKKVSLHTLTKTPV